MDNEKMLTLRLPNAAPFVYEFDPNQNFKPVKNYYIEDEDR